MPIGGLSIHAVDIRHGLAAAGLHVDVFHVAGTDRICVASGRIGDNALLDDAALSTTLPAGGYEVHFHVRDYFVANRPDPALPDLLDTVVFAFTIDDPDKHIHLPMKFSPVGYSLFKGDP